MDLRLPPALRSYYPRLLMKDRSLAVTLGLIILGLAMTLLLGLPVSEGPRILLGFCAWASLIASTFVSRARANRVIRESKTAKLL